MTNNKSKGILLESGTNELELLEFSIMNRHFGINVSKVVAINQSTDVVPMPNSNPFVEGIFQPRDELMTLINLPAYLGLAKSENPERDIYIVTNFNKVSTAFHVHTVESTHRVSWDKIEKPDKTIYGGEDGLVTGITRIDGRLVTIIDFEKILVDINPAAGIQMSEIEKLGHRKETNKPIFVAEDSPLLEKMLLESLVKSGYHNVTCFSNGKDCWDTLNKIKQDGLTLFDHCCCVITDIEMPKMDGHRLTKLIKEDEFLKPLPVVIFSSLINEEMRMKGESLGANAQLSKPEIGNLVHAIDHLVLD